MVKLHLELAGEVEEVARVLREIGGCGACCHPETRRSTSLDTGPQCAGNSRMNRFT